MKKSTVLFLAFYAQFAVAVEVSPAVKFSPITNLVYQLDCVSGDLIHCSDRTYGDLWEKEFLRNEEDRALLRKWREWMERYQAQARIGDPKAPPISGRFNGVELATKARIAAFQAKDMSDYFSRLDLVLVPKDRIAVETVIRHFHPRFEAWWKREALKRGASFARQTKSLLESPAILKKIDQFYRFYEVDLPKNYEVSFNLIYRPANKKESTSGQQIENYSVVEFLPTEKPEERIDVVLHELCHFFLDNGKDEKALALRKGFAENGGPSAIAAYNLLNEGLATAFGNGMIARLYMKNERWQKYLAEEQSFYNDFFVDRAAKTVLPWLGEWLEAGKSLYDERFVKTYVSSLEAAMGEKLTAPKMLLKEMVLVVDARYGGKFRDHVRRSFSASSMYTSEGHWQDEQMLRVYTENADLNALIVVHPDNFQRLNEGKILSEESVSQLKSAFKESKRAVYSFKSTPSRTVYVVAAPAYDEALKLIEKLASLERSFDGAWQ